MVDYLGLRYIQNPPKFPTHFKPELLTLDSLTKILIVSKISKSSWEDVYKKNLKFLLKIWWSQ